MKQDRLSDFSPGRGICARLPEERWDILGPSFRCGVVGHFVVGQYVDVLASGGSDYPDKILAKIGVDLNDPAFWNKGLDAIRKLVDQEEQLARELYPEKFQ